MNDVIDDVILRLRSMLNIKKFNEFIYLFSYFENKYKINCMKMQYLI